MTIYRDQALDALNKERGDHEETHSRHTEILG